MDDEPIIVMPRVIDRFGKRRSDDDVIGARCHDIELDRLPGEPVEALAERAAQGRTCVVQLRYRVHA